jgi:hypothetical protein
MVVDRLRNSSHSGPTGLVWDPERAHDEPSLLKTRKPCATNPFLEA